MKTEPVDKLKQIYDLINAGLLYGKSQKGKWIRKRVLEKRGKEDSHTNVYTEK